MSVYVKIIIAIVACLVVFGTIVYIATSRRGKESRMDKLLHLRARIDRIEDGAIQYSHTDQTENLKRLKTEYNRLARELGEKELPV